MSVTLQPHVPTEPADRQRAEPPPALAPAPAGRLAWTPKNVLVGLLLLWLLSGFYMVPADAQAVATRFGKIVAKRVMPGVHYNWPWPLGSIYRLKVRELQREVVGGEIVDNVIGTADPLTAQFLTGDQNIIHVRTVVQFSVATPSDYLFHAFEVKQAVKNAVEAELGRQIAARTVDAVLTTEKVAIQEEVRRRAQRLLDDYGLGVAVSTVNIEQAAAPPEAADAFRDVASARADLARIISEAEGYANDIVPRARGEAQQMLAAAQAHKRRKIDEALGDASRFVQLAREYAKYPEITRSRLYLETMEEVLPRLNKTIVDDRGNFDLTIVRRRRNGSGGALKSLEK